MMLSIDGSRLMATKYLLMASSFADGACRNRQFKALGLASQFDVHCSMHRRTGTVVGGPRHAVTLGAQLVKDIQHSLFARVHEGPAGDVLGVLQKLFGFSEFFHAASVRGPACKCMQIFLNKVERK
ncbi:hypothetical protein [Achromobacter sp. GD03932]|uniref:hypothetical protein n=1 Tax=Achromobacter sp. GD03932 TaxID=2975407 RepID=UPI00244A5C9A|nr:hypothetical protein [Achromobacter sp. GD03932]MDH1299701.1 hypothetical protein [Achromobacter sp. GD03932]